jgi:hypothetical protein
MRPHFLLLAAALPALACGERRPAPEREPVATRPVTAELPTVQAASHPTRGSASPASTPTTAARPSMPRVIERFCEGESCEVGGYAALACTVVGLRAAASDTAPVVARVERGDTVHVRARDLHVLEPGLIVMRRDFTLDWEMDVESGRYPRTDTLRFAAGDTVYLLHYTELGDWVWWYRGREERGSEFWAGPQDEDLGAATHSRDSSTAVGLTHPVRADWWHVRPRSGKPGWWRADTLHSLMSIAMMQKWNDECPTQ